MPYLFQLANGLTTWALNVSIIAMLVSVPATLYFTIQYGVIGAASVWVVINLGHTFLSINFIKEEIFKKEKWRWYTKDLLTPLSVALILFIILLQIYPFQHSLTFDFIGYVLVFVIIELTLIWLYFKAALINLFKKII